MSCAHADKQRKRHVGADAHYWYCPDCGEQWGEHESAEDIARRRALIAGAAEAIDLFDEDELERFAAASARARALRERDDS